MQKRWWTEGQSPSLEEVLQNKEERVCRLMKWEKHSPEASFLCMKLNIPGPIKNNEQIIAMYEFMREEVTGYLNEKRMGFRIVWESLSAKTGPESIWRIEEEGRRVKQCMVALEENSPMSRLYDLDIRFRGENINREGLGVSERTCFVCERPAKLCARERRHSFDELFEAIDEAWQQRANNS